MTEQLVTAGVGQELPVLTREVNQEGINRYAAVSGDGNPLHTDPAFAATTRFGGPIAHGMLVLAYVSECLTAAFGERWLASGRLKVRFRGPAHPGDTVTVSGRVTRRDGRRLFAEVEAQNQQGEPLITADAEVEV